MPPVIYKRQKQILEFIHQYIQAHGSAPTLRQIADSIDVSSLATVHEHLVTLENKGLIKRRTGKNRAIELVSKSFDYSGEREIEIPVLGFIAAGEPIEACTDPNAKIGIAPSFITGKKRVYVLQVRGNSMIDEQIRDGDYVIVEETDNAQNGQIVVALLDNGMATLKRFYRETTRIRLEPANSTMNPIFVRNVRIQGRVVGLIRKYLPN